MHRTQILLEDHQYEALQRRAREQQTSLARLIRDMIDVQLADPNGEDQDDPLLALKGAWQGDASVQARDYKSLLYR